MENMPSLNKIIKGDFMTKKQSNATDQEDAHEIKNKRQALSELKRSKRETNFLTEKQKEFWDIINTHDITLCTGPAGTGNTYSSITYALEQLGTNPEIDGIILCRPMMPLNNQQIGFLPGDLSQKVEPYMMSYWNIIEEIIGRASARALKEAEVIQVIPEAFFRGLTYKNKIVLYDEAQNTTPEAMLAFLTRLGERSKFVVMGDVKQSDRKRGEIGLTDAIHRIGDLSEVGTINFEIKDVVRHGLIKKILERYED